MRKTVFIGIISLAFLFPSCKSEFELVRASGDVDMIYKKAMAYYDEEDYLKAQTLFEIILGALRGRPELEDVYFKYAYTFYHLEKYILASYYFETFSSTFPTSTLRQESDFMNAYSNFRLSPTYRLDQTYTEKAIELFQLYINSYPDNEKVEECNQLIEGLRAKLEKKAYESAKLYFDLRQYQAATQSLENLLKDFPDTDNGEEVRYLIVKAYYELASNSIVDKRKERYETAKKYANEFLNRYQKSKFRKEVRAMLALTETQLKA